MPGVIHVRAVMIAMCIMMFCRSVNSMIHRLFLHIISVCFGRRIPVMPMLIMSVSAGFVFHCATFITHKH